MSKAVPPTRVIRLREKLFLSVALLLFVTVGTIGFYAYANSYATYTELLRRIIDADLQKSEVELTAELQSMQNKALLFSHAADIRAALDPPPNTSRSRDYEDYLTLQRYIGLFVETGDGYKIRLFLNNNRRYFHDDEQIFPALSALEQEPRSVLTYEPGVRWTTTYATTDQAGSSRRVISCVVPIMSLRDIGRVTGVVAFDLDEASVQRALAPLLRWEKISYGLFNRRFRAIAAGTGSATIQQLSDELETDLTQPGIKQGHVVSHGNGTPSMVFSAPVSSGLFQLILDIPLIGLQKQSFLLIRGLLAILIPVLIASFSLSYYIANNITKRLRRLVVSMNSVEQNDFTEHIPAVGTDEVADLTHAFNHMISRTRSLIDDVYLARIRNAKMQLDLLQAQINPHFLYNTLDTINWEAKRLKARNISYMIDQLSDFIRLSLNSGRDTTTVVNEIQQVRAYHNILKRRFDNAVQLDVRIPAVYYRCSCPHFVLQPIIENACVHGILPKEDSHGVVVVGADATGDVLHLWVQDDGVGFDPEKLLEVRSLMEEGVVTSPGKSFGLININGRIRIAYGSGYGVSIDEPAEGGTRVTCSFPIAYATAETELAANGDRKANENERE